MNWILLATLGQFLNAIVAILDKYIVSDEQALPKPFVYAFYSCLLTGFWVVIFLVSSQPTDECGGAAVAGQYGYYLSAEHSAVLGCFAAPPQTLP